MTDRIRTRTRSRDVRLLIGLVVAPLALVAGLIPAGALAQPAATQQADESATGPEPQALANGLKAGGFGHYVKMRAPDAVDHAQRLNDAEYACKKKQVDGIRWVEDWKTVEGPTWGDHHFSELWDVINRIKTLDAERGRPCRILFTIRWVTFKENSNPCPAYIPMTYPTNSGGKNCGMWQQWKADAFANMIAAFGANFDNNPHVQGVIFSETATGMHPSQADNYNATTYSDNLMDIYQTCSTSFPTSWCLPAFNFLPADSEGNGQEMLRPMAETLASKPNICLHANDLWLGNDSLQQHTDSIYQLIVDFPGCRSASAENHGYGDGFDLDEDGEPDPIPGFDGAYTPTAGVTLCTDPNPVDGYGHLTACNLNEVWRFAVRGTINPNTGEGTFDADKDFDAGLCINGYIIWQFRGLGWVSQTGNRFEEEGPPGTEHRSALSRMADHPYGPDWTNRCPGGGGPLN